MPAFAQIDQGSKRSPWTSPKPLSRDLLTASVTLADKNNISDDFSRDFPSGYPNDPADMEAEWGYARGHERYRLVLSGIFHAPWGLTVAPIYEYGSGQPWTHRLGYDFNGDGKNSDRPSGVGRNEDDRGRRVPQRPTAANPNLTAVRNPRFGQYNATFPAREFQLGVGWVF